MDKTANTISTAAFVAGLCLSALCAHAATINVDCDAGNTITEIILALDPDVTGDTTALYLMKQLNMREAQYKITRLARGLQNGAQIEYADGSTISDAWTNRRVL